MGAGNVAPLAFGDSITISLIQIKLQSAAKDHNETSFEGINHDIGNTHPRHIARHTQLHCKLGMYANHLVS